MTGRIFQGDLNRMHISKNQTRYVIDLEGIDTINEGMDFTWY